MPFTKRSEYFAQFEQLLLDTEGGGEGEARAGADIVITGEHRGEGALWMGAFIHFSGDQAALGKLGQGKGRTFTDLQEGLNAAKEGDVVYVEPGFHYREEGFTVHSSITLLGSSTRGVQLVSRGAPTLQVTQRANYDSNLFYQSNKKLTVFYQVADICFLNSSRVDSPP